MDRVVVRLFLVFLTLVCAECTPLEQEPAVDPPTTHLCEFVIGGLSDVEEDVGVGLFHRGNKLDSRTICRLHVHSIANGGEKWANIRQVEQILADEFIRSDGIIRVECKLNNGETIRSCVQSGYTDKFAGRKLPSVRLSRRLLSAETNGWKDTSSESVTIGAVIGGFGGMILLIVVIVLCAGKGEKEEPVKGVRISRISSVKVGQSVSMQDVEMALAKCDSSTETGPSAENTDKRVSTGTDRNSLHADSAIANNVDNQQRPNSQVSIGSVGSAQAKPPLVHVNGKTIDRRLPQPPPAAAMPSMPDDKKDPNYDKLTDENDPNYSKLKDPDYEKIKRQKQNDSEDATDPNYEPVKVASDGDGEASGRDTITGDDLYAEVKDNNTKSDVQDMYAKVDKDPQANEKEEDSARLSMTVDDPYATVKGEDSAAPPVPVKLPDLQLDSSPGPNPKQQRTGSQGSTTSAGPPVSPIDRPLPQQPTSSTRRREPSYSEVSVRESIGSIKEREARAKQEVSFTYETVDELNESDVYYSTVKTTESSPPPLTSPPPPLPSDSTRPSNLGSVSSTRDAGMTLTVESGGNRSSTSSALYASIGDTDALPVPLPAETPDKGDKTTGMPVYAKVNKPKRNSSSSQDGQAANSDEQSVPMYSKVNKPRKSKSSDPEDANDPKSQRLSQRSSQGSTKGNDPGYARIKDLTEDTEPGYQAIDEVRGDGGEVMRGSDMVHISEHKVDDNFWKKKDPTYQSIKEDNTNENEDGDKT
ncbi:protein IWS1 homolog A-like isoform X2 [Ptychodera flava]|uniref:protein IWS1 homolog A-like isoform X2 n=1 Tax=Ptychodera flava TaxID=63121 RepID=UPI00396A23EF